MTVLTGFTPSDAAADVRDTLNEALARTVGTPADWTNAPGGAEPPIIGGRFNSRMARPKGVRRLAHFATVASMNSASAFMADITDADGSLYGDTVCRFTSSTTTSRYLAPAGAGSPVDVASGSIRLRFRPVSAWSNTAIDRFSLELHSAGTPAAITANYHKSYEFTFAASPFFSFATSNTGIGLWQTVSVPISGFSAVGTGADLANITFARLWIRTVSGQTVICDIDGIDFAPNSRTKAACVISFDDGHLLSYAAKAMARYGFPGVIYPGAIAGDIGGVGKLTVANAKSLHDQLGWQVASQAWSSEQLAAFQALGPVGRTRELSKMRAVHAALGLTGGVDGSYFSAVGVQAIDVFEAFRQHFRSMRLFITPSSAGVPIVYGETLPVGDPMRLRAMALKTDSGTPSVNAERNQAHIDDAIANKGLAIFVMHNDTGTAGAARTAFDSMLTYLDTQRANIDVLTLDQVLADV